MLTSEPSDFDALLIHHRATEAENARLRERVNGLESREAGLADTPLVVGGIIPEDDAAALRAMGVAAVYTPKDFELNRIMLDIVGLVDKAAVAAE